MIEEDLAVMTMLTPIIVSRIVECTGVFFQCNFKSRNPAKVEPKKRIQKAILVFNCVAFLGLVATFYLSWSYLDE